MRTTAGDLFSPVLQHTHIHTLIQTDKHTHAHTHAGGKTSSNTKVKMEQKSLEEDRKSTENNEIYHGRLLKASRLLKNQTFTN